MKSITRLTCMTLLSALTATHGAMASPSGVTKDWVIDYVRGQITSLPPGPQGPVGPMGPMGPMGEPFKYQAGAGIDPNKLSEGTIELTAPTTYQVGQQAQGGTIVYVTHSGLHGLVMSNQDVVTPDATTFQYQEATSLATSPLGYENNIAAQDYLGWHIPSQAEWRMICTAVLNGSVPPASMPDGTYWTATPLNNWPRYLISTITTKNSVTCSVEGADQYQYDTNKNTIRTVRVF